MPRQMEKLQLTCGVCEIGPAVTLWPIVAQANAGNYCQGYALKIRDGVVCCAISLAR